MENNTKRNIIILVIILLVFVGAYFILDMIFNKEKTDIEFLRNYEVNEYIPTYITAEEMAEIYLKDYTYKMFVDAKIGYELLDEEYREKKFGTLENYKEYIKTLNYSTYDLARYYIDDSKGYEILGVYDKNGNLFIFKTNGVMQYSVYLDDYTVEI